MAEPWSGEMAAQMELLADLLVRESDKAMVRAALARITELTQGNEALRGGLDVAIRMHDIAKGHLAELTAENARLTAALAEAQAYSESVGAAVAAIDWDDVDCGCYESPPGVAHACVLHGGSGLPRLLPDAKGGGNG